jgi:hypothetical protein
MENNVGHQICPKLSIKTSIPVKNKASPFFVFSFYLGLNSTYIDPWGYVPQSKISFFFFGESRIGICNLRVFHSRVPHNFQEQSATLESHLGFSYYQKIKKKTICWRLRSLTWKALEIISS